MRARGSHGENAHLDIMRSCGSSIDGNGVTAGANPPSPFHLNQIDSDGFCAAVTDSKPGSDYPQRCSGDSVFKCDMHHIIDVACESHSIAVLSVKRPSLGPLDQSLTFKYTAIS
ncbi:hypothetical protein F2P81_019836 [Scophthalmus maximus]|uniref:Uncharacterized protein n=1 Tax=Scophthalmus maximus TaxID=52904 RepID=A0A6A4S4C5_SCOMX|nr:hypothetical protein F2P81_019836 [Scophthalmus maximus]